MTLPTARTGSDHRETFVSGRMNGTFVLRHSRSKSRLRSASGR
jgi:hypothetical protein